MEEEEATRKIASLIGNGTSTMLNKLALVQDTLESLIQLTPLFSLSTLSDSPSEPSSTTSWSFGLPKLVAQSALIMMVIQKLQGLVRACSSWREWFQKRR
jgi:hypothetical protein